MPVNQEDVAAGAIFFVRAAFGAEGAAGSLRRVTQVSADRRVSWEQKSAGIGGRPFDGGPPATHPTPMERFCEDCDHVLTNDEIQHYRDRNIILDDEVQADLHP
jgi:hypothetical protein